MRLQYLKDEKSELFYIALFFLVNPENVLSHTRLWASNLSLLSVIGRLSLTRSTLSPEQSLEGVGSSREQARGDIGDEWW